MFEEEQTQSRQLLILGISKIASHAKTILCIAINILYQSISHTLNQMRTISCVLKMLIHISHCFSSLIKHTHTHPFDMCDVIQTLN